MSDDLISIPVPRKHLPAIYAFISSLDQPNHPAVAQKVDVDSGSNGKESTEYDDWTNMRLRRMIDESPKAMICILRLLASNPDKWHTAEDLARSITHKPDATWNTVAGTLGAFGRRVMNRYQIETWPFEDQYDHEVGGRAYRMSSEMASRVIPYLESR